MQNVGGDESRRSSEVASNIKALHSYLYGRFPALFLYSHSIDQASIYSAAAAIVLSLAIVCVLFVLFDPILKDLTKSALFVSAVVVVFFSYEHLHAAVLFFEEALTCKADFPRINFAARLDLFFHLPLIALILLQMKSMAELLKSTGYLFANNGDK